MRKFIFGALVAMVLVACAKEETPIAKIEEVKNPYAVTPDEAVQLLKTVIGGETTRAVSIGDIKTLRKSDFVPTTRGGEDGDLIYIVDLENGGSAVMGADKRMEPIYAILDETKISPEKLTQVATRGDDSEQDIEDYVMGLMNNKIQADANSYAFVKDTLHIPSLRSEYWLETTTLAQVLPKLRTKWHQHAPYNNQISQSMGLPDVAAGCVPIAIGQIMAYYQHNVYGMTFDWNLLNMCRYGVTMTSAAESEVARFIKAIRDQLTSPIGLSQCVFFMGTYAGFSNVNSSDYNYNSVKNMLISGRPVFIGGTSNEGDHTWVIDGYHYYRLDEWERSYVGMHIDEEKIIATYYYNLVHCNYGWGGPCDGYYSEGLFNVSRQRNSDELDTSIGDSTGTRPFDLDTDICIITYSN